MVAVHKQRLREARAAVDGIHHKDKIRQAGFHQRIHGRLRLRQQIQQQRRAGNQKGAHERNLFDGAPQNPAVTLDKQLVQIGESPAVAGDRTIRGNGLFRILFRRLRGGVHLLKKLPEQFLIDFPIRAERQQLPHAQRAGKHKRQQNGSGNSRRQRSADGRQPIRGGQKQRRQQPRAFVERILVIRPSALLIRAQRQSRRRQLAAHNRKGQHKAQPERNAVRQPEEKRKRQKADDHLHQRIRIIDQRIGTRVHPHQNHRIVFVPRRIEQAGVHKSADDRKAKQDMQEHRPPRRVLVQHPDAGDHRQHIQKLAEESRKQFPHGGQQAGEALQAPRTVKRLRQKPTQKRNLLERIQNAVDPICVFQSERQAEGATHRRPPAARQ